jgi:transketolase
MGLKISVLGFLKEIAFIFKNLVFMIIESSKSGHLGLPLGNFRTGSFLFAYLLNFYNKKPK